MKTEKEDAPSVVFVEPSQVKLEYQRPKREIIFKRYQEIYIEEKSTKAKVKRFRCQKCRKSRSFLTQKHLDRHMQIGHSKKAEKSVKCEICEKPLKSENYLKRHIATKHPENPKMFICDYDGRSFTAKDYIRIHMDRHRKHQTYTCSICMKSYISKHTFRRHLKMVKHITRTFNMSLIGCFCSTSRNIPA